RVISWRRGPKAPLWQSGTTSTKGSATTDRCERFQQIQLDGLVDLRRDTSLLGIRLPNESSIAAVFSAREPSRHCARANVCVRRDRDSSAHHTGAIYGGLLHRRAGRCERGNHLG